MLNCRPQAFGKNTANGEKEQRRDEGAVNRPETFRIGVEDTTCATRITQWERWQLLYCNIGHNKCQRWLFAPTTQTQNAPGEISLNSIESECKCNSDAWNATEMFGMWVKSVLQSDENAKQLRHSARQRQRGNRFKCSDKNKWLWKIANKRNERNEQDNKIYQRLSLRCVSQDKMRTQL